MKRDERVGSISIDGAEVDNLEYADRKQTSDLTMTGSECTFFLVVIRLVSF